MNLYSIETIDYYTASLIKTNLEKNPKLPYRYGMTQNTEIILEGSYLYYQKDVHYSQENFKLVHIPEAQSYYLYAEILSRIETGEFLKILVKYEMNNHLMPFAARIEKSIGKKYALETYKLDLTSLEMNYIFQTPEHTQEFKKNISAKHYLTSPAFCTSAIFTLTKKFDATGRTPIVLIGSENNWTYQNPPSEKIIHAEFKSRDMSDFKLQGNQLSASLLSLYEYDSSHPTLEEPVDIYLSKHYAIPYQLIHGEQKIVIKQLKKNTL